MLLSQSTPYIAAFAPLPVKRMMVGLYQHNNLFMNIHHIPHNVKVFGNEVKTFPQGISEAFDKLIQMLPKKDERPYYGISWCEGNNITYIAAAEQQQEGEAKKYGCKTYTVEKGDYLSVPVYDWLNKICNIKNVFEEIIKDSRADDKQPAIEVYKNDKEMLCMVKMRVSVENLEEFNPTVHELLKIIKNFNEEQINKIPFEDSWTAAQVIVHITKSNKSIAKAMKLEGEQVERDADERVTELRNTFLDYTVKFKSPDFIVPEEGPYEREKVIADFETSVEQLKKSSKEAMLSEAIKHPAFGEITKLELLHFVLFHIQRHTRQLKHIYSSVKSKQHIHG